MGQTIKPTPPAHLEHDEIEDKADEVIELRDADACLAVRKLTRGQTLTQSELAKIVLAGYVRRRLH